MQETTEKATNMMEAQTVNPGNQPPSDNPEEGSSTTSEVEPDTTAQTEEREVEDPRFAEKMALIMRRERALQQKERAIKERLRNDPDYLEFQKFKKLREKAGEAPDELLKEFGWDYDRLIRHKLGEKEAEPSAEEKLQARIDALEAKLSEREKMERESEEERITRGALHQIDKTLQENEDEFELTVFNNASQLVYDVIKEHYLKTGETLPIKAAAQAVEEHFEREQLEKFAKSKKLRRKLIPEEQQPDKEPEHQESSSEGKSSTTISSRTIQSGSVDSDDDVFLDDEASKRLIAERWKSGYYNRG